MPKIKHLPVHEAQKIAAGQVIERPADIIKELIENSIDAGATAITLYVEDAGKQLIRIVDNGCGMDADDAELCFEKHATSKIGSLEELQQISTFGFRGEAMPSIAAVCKVTLITKQHDAHEGIKLTLENGAIQDRQITSAATGTDISAADLFHNIPVRKKFLKKNDTELRHITQLFHSFCLDYPTIHFKLFSDNKQTLNCPPVQKITDRCAQLWQNISATHLLAVDAHHKKEALRIAGVISDHQNFRFDRSNIFLFVNKRWIKDFKLVNAFVKGYMDVAPHGRYPMGSIAITIDPQLVDVNVHPRKEEVRFLNPRMVEQLLQTTIKTCLEENIAKRVNTHTIANAHMPAHISEKFEDNSKPFTLNQTSQNFESNSEPFALPVHRSFNEVGSLSKGRPAYASASYSHASSTTHYQSATDSRNNGHNAHEQNQTSYQPFNFDAVFPDPHVWGKEDSENVTPHYSASITQQTHALTDQEQHQDYVSQATPASIQTTINSQSTTDTHPNYTLIGQYNKTYILIEQEDGLFVVDQHAAHERILYELFAHRFNEVAIVQLLFPVLIPLSQEDITTIEPYLPLFVQNGINIELFGINQLKIDATPVHLKDMSLEDLVRQSVGWINEYQHLDEQQFAKKLHEKLRAQMACKAAVKAGDILTHTHMQELLATLHTTENRLTCPHGRPTGWLLSLYEIEKKFKRDYK